MSDLARQLQDHVDAGDLLGALSIIERHGEEDVVVVGRSRLDSDTPLARDALFRVASLTKPIMAAAAMTLVDDGTAALDDEVSRWIPELAHPVVVRTPASPLDDVVPADRPVTVRDVLASTTGWGFGSEFASPAAQANGALHVDGSTAPVSPDDWVAALGRTPMLRQPGRSFLYNVSYDLLGVLLARVCDQDLPTVLAERVLEPLGLRGTGFHVPAAERHRLADCYQLVDGHLAAVELHDPDLATAPAFPSGSGGLVSTADDLLRFARMLLADGRSATGEQVLSAGSVATMTTDQLRPEQREDGAMFLDGQGWGYGGGVDTTLRDPWNALGRYGWVGGTGTSLYLCPASGTAAVMLTQRTIDGPGSVRHLEQAWTASAQA